MVAMVETREGTKVFVGEIDPAALPLTVMLYDAKQSGEKSGLRGQVKLVPLAIPYSDEPTWEDAAWQ
jgi:hypothetical protein